MKKLVVGLGNPGKEFEGTRHNMGYMVVEKVAELEKIPFRGGKGMWLEARGKKKEYEFMLAKPLTYMNMSGVVVKEIVDQEKVDLPDLLIVYDDMDLPLGKLRFRPKGGSGGHRGMASVIWALETEEIPRLRVGIGRPPLHINPVDWVLSKFDEDVSEVVERAAKGVQVWMEEGIERAANLFNKEET